MKPIKRKSKKKATKGEHFIWDIISVIVIVGFIYTLCGMVLYRDVQIGLLKNELSTDENYLRYPTKSYWTSDKDFCDWKCWRKEIAFKNTNQDLYCTWLSCQKYYYKAVSMINRKGDNSNDSN